ncbi:MAG: hypothetical protein GY851_05900 [bacterium]|nr:hypothetical protein [bacterium]
MPEESPYIDRLLHVADLHFWQVVTNPLRLLNKRFLGNLNVLLRRRREFPMARAAEHVDALVNAEIPDVLMTGDFTSTSTDEEFTLARGFVDGMCDEGLRPVILPGNHDVYTFGAARSGRFERHFEGLLPETPPSLVRLPGGTPIILVPTVCPNVLSSAGRVSAETVERVRGLLAECDGPTIVAGHYPLLERTYGYKLTRQRRLRGSDALRSALGDAGRPILYLCGHVHRFSHVRDERYPPLQHVSTAAFFQNRAHAGTAGEFAEVHVGDEGFSVFRHVRETKWNRSLEDPRPSGLVSNASTP